MDENLKNAAILDSSKGQTDRQTSIEAKAIIMVTTIQTFPKPIVTCVNTRSMSMATNT